MGLNGDRGSIQEQGPECVADGGQDEQVFKEVYQFEFAGVDPKEKQTQKTITLH